MLTDLLEKTRVTSCPALPTKHPRAGCAGDRCSRERRTGRCADSGR